MGTVSQKHLDWIERAPVSFSGSATTTASPQAVFAILADHERWPEWFPVLKKEEVLGPRREGVGTRRVATIPGGKVEELIIAWDPGQRFAFTATAVAKVFLGCRTKILRTADAFYAWRREGPYRFIQNRPRTFLAALKSYGAAEKSKDQLLRDFWGCSMFDFCNTIHPTTDVAQ
jgi:hypothetical protein